MYLDYFNIKEHPFRVTPDPKFLYLGQVHSRAIAYMEYALMNRDSFVLISGEIGSGKTTLIQKLLSEMDKDIIVAKIHQTQLTPTEFLQALLVEFGFKPFRAQKIELLAMINDFLEKQSARGVQVVLIVDEAQKLSPEVLEEIRMLSSIETRNERILNVILTGQPELARTLNLPRMEQLNQRIRLRFHIRALKEEEVPVYIRHRLEVAGAENPDLFKKELMPLIYEYAGGVPRLLNTLCDSALLVACVEDMKEVNEAAIRRAIEDLDWVPYEERHDSPMLTRQNLPKHAKVIVTTDDHTIGEYAIEKQFFMIGRTHTNDIQLDGNNVSAFHSMIYHVDDTFWLIDLHSRNGTFKGAKRVARYQLKHGDEFSITKRYRMKFIDESSEIEDENDVTGAEDTESPVLKKAGNVKSV